MILSAAAFVRIERIGAPEKKVQIGWVLNFVHALMLPVEKRTVRLSYRAQFGALIAARTATCESG